MKCFIAYSFLDVGGDSGWAAPQLPAHRNLALSGAITQVWTKMILWTLSALTRILKEARKNALLEIIDMANAKSALTCGCPVAAFQKMISGKYKLRIVWDLKDGPLRYGEIRTGLLRGSDGTSEIAPRVLSRELKALTETGLIDRKDYGVVPPKVEYRLTRKGRSFVPVIAAIRNWGTRHLAQTNTVEMVAAE
jgi:DNA-binding HxlR family transcriptional regulator